MTLSTDIDALPQVTETQPVKRLPRGRSLPVAIISAVTIGVIIAAWGLASVYALVSPVFLPSPRQVVLALYNLVVTGFVDATLAEHVGASLTHIFGALIASILIGIPAGIAIGTSRLGRGVLDPIVEFLRPLPPLAYLPLIIIWVGIGEASKITVIALSMLPSIILSTSAGVRGVSKDHVNAARSLGASRA